MLGGSLSMSDSTIARSGVAVLGTSAAVTIERSNITNNRQGVGVSGGDLVLRRSLVASNGSGVSCNASTCEITNNIIVRNGNLADALVGGLRVDTSAPLLKIAFNTIAYNMVPSAATNRAGGVYCDEPHDLRNNIIYNNVAGTNTNPLAQTGGSCVFPGSIIQDGNGTNEMHFVSTGDPGDFHLADLGSPAVGMGVVVPQPETDVDFDGEARPSPPGSMPDVGADEFYP